MTSAHARLLLRAASAAVLVAVLTHTRADPDLFGHVRFGQDIVRSASIPRWDPYSFTSDRPWINHEWLAEAAMYLAYAAAGSAGLVALKLVLLAAMGCAAVLVLRRAEMSAAARDLLIALLVLGTFPQANHVRPQLFSLALFAWLVYLLEIAGSRPHVLLLGIPIMALWVNLHGGWLVGAGIFGVWAAAALVGPSAGRTKLLLTAYAAAALMATVCNPYGVAMWQFLRDTVAFGRADITDWQPIFVVGPMYLALWLMTAAAAAAGIAHAVKRRPLELARIAIVVLLGAGSARVGRLLAFFTIATVTLLGPALAAGISRVTSRPARPQPRLAIAIVILVALAIGASSTIVSARNVSCIRMEPAMFPESGVAAMVAAQRVRGRMLIWFDWGEYAIWYFAPDVSVSMDGRRETVYSDATIQRQLRFYSAPDERHQLVDALSPDYIWMPSQLTVTARLAADGWQPIFTGPRSTLLKRTAGLASLAQPAAAGPAGRPVGSAERPDAARCFPGP